MQTEFDEQLELVREKCLNCEKEAKWKSAIYVSPLCSTCARKEVDNLIKTGKYIKSW